ncbi:MAG: NUDIX domain-containing protein [Acidimicrobiia bacterium]
MRSAGLLPYRFRPGIEVLIAHPGGPFFAHRDDGAWSVIKGLVDRGEADEAAAAREFEEETGWPAPKGKWIPLEERTLKSGKVVVAWATEADFDPETLEPGTFVMQGRRYPEIDRVAWFTPEEARRKLNPAQAVFIDRLEANLGLNRRQT